MDEIVANLGRDNDLVALGRERLGNKLLAQPVAVSIGGIEQGYPQIEGFVHEGNRFAFSEGAPPPGRDCPEPKADFADGEVGVFIRPKLHNERITAEATEVTEKIGFNLRVLRDLCG